MQERIVEILSEATGWMTANEIADKGKWRSPAHVGLALKQMAGVEHRTSPTKKMGNGMPAKEYKLVDKRFANDQQPEKVVAKAKPQPVEAPAKVEKKEQPAAGLEAYNLRQRLENAEKQRDDHFNRAEDYLSQLVISENAVSAWLALAAEHECKSIPDLRVFIGSLESRVTSLKMAVDSLTEQMNAKFHTVSDGQQYMVRTIKKAPRVFKLRKNAHAAAMSAARTNGLAEMFALVPVGKAIRGAEWRDS